MPFNYPQLKNPQRCSKCASCMNSCPLHAITRIEPFEVDVSKCAKKGECFTCAMACKTGALVLMSGN
ncbi:MAG: 4Fe-4S binding protein [Candidatus Jordarchaeales archaeon]|nr:4Fe-4S binding protein [Candidatus Jordarchaeia archaeon]